MKRNIIFVVFALLLAGALHAQSITFGQTNYNPGDHVTGQLSLTANKQITGIGNDITSSSSGAPADPQNIDLGNIPGPGFFQISFSFDDGSVELYNLVIFASGGNNDQAGSVLFVNNPVQDVSSYNNFYTTLKGAIGSLNFSSILKETGKEYIVNNPLSTTITFVLCVGATVQPELAGACGQGAVGNAKEFFKILLKQTVIEMANEGLITDDQKQTFITLFNFVPAALSIKTLIADQSWDNLISAVSAAANATLDDGSALNMTIQQNKQLYDQTRFLLKLVKPGSN